MASWPEYGGSETVKGRSGGGLGELREVEEWTGTVKCGIVVDQKADVIACMVPVVIKTF